MAPLACELTSNPNITGIGIRLAVYLSTALPALVIHTLQICISEEIRPPFSDSSNMALSVVLIATALRSLGSGLSLIDAQMVTMLALIVFIYDVRLSSSGISARCAALHLLHGIGCSAFAFIVYANPSAFGGAIHNIECTNDATIFPMFGHPIRATNSGLRIWALTYFAGSVLEVLCRFFPGALRMLWRLDPLPTVSKNKYLSLGGFWAEYTWLVVTIEQMVLWNGVQAQSNQWNFSGILGILASFLYFV